MMISLQYHTNIIHQFIVLNQKQYNNNKFINQGNPQKD